MIRSLNKEYAPIGGEGDFCQKAAKLAEISNVLTEARNVTIQGISGTGFFTISAELWGSHTPIFKFSGSWLSYFILDGHNATFCVLLAQNFAMNTCLYAERAGAFTVVCTDKDEAARSVRVKSI